MAEILRKLWPLLLLAASPLAAQVPLTFYLHDPTGAVADTPLTNPYSFPSTAVNSYSSISVNAVNTSSSTLLLGTVLVSTATGNITPETDFAVTNVLVDQILSPGASTVFTVGFTPQSTGAKVGYLRVVYQTETSSCSLTSQQAATQCASAISTMSELEGTAIAAAFTITYQSSTNGTPYPSGLVIQPGIETPLSFGDVSLSNTATITFAITNSGGSTAAVPTLTLTTQLNLISPFALNVSGVPSTLAASASADFTITFGPGSLGLSTALLLVGNAPYAIQGIGVALADIDTLQISYVTPSGVLVDPTGATPIAFGTVVNGSGGSVIYSFTATNPSVSFNAVTVPTLSVSGSGFALAGGPSIPVTIAPGDSITWTVTFTPTGVGTYTGVLAVGARSFALGGLSPASALPSYTMQLATHPPLSAMSPDNLTITFSSASAVTANGTLTMTFTPSVAGAADDPEVQFAATGGRTITVNIASGNTQATYSGSANIGVNTGYTAGTITFSLTWPDQTPQVQTFTVSPALVHIISTNAVWSSPNVVVTTTGWDNTYTAGTIVYTFYNSSGGVISCPTCTVDDTTGFHALFFGAGNTYGGQFVFPVTFPVTSGSVTSIATVSYTMTNSVGTTSSGSVAFHY